MMGLNATSAPTSGRRRQFRGWALAWVLLGLAGLSSLASARDVTPEELQLSAQAARSARDQCQRLMHEDAVEFTHCADSLLTGLPRKRRAQQFAYLGAAYYAWLASTSAAKNGLPNAELAARHFLHLFRPVQKALKVSDQQLCPTIEGECVARIARLTAMEHEPVQLDTLPRDLASRASKH